MYYGEVGYRRAGQFFNIWDYPISCWRNNHSHITVYDGGTIVIGSEIGREVM